MPLGVRGSNPIWAEFDLTGKIFDDTYYMFVLKNVMPYDPATVWHDNNMTTPWVTPIRFQANGTLQNDIYFDPNTTYRLEFRKGNLAASPLIYLVENYVPQGTGVVPTPTTGLFSDNQITNPQFSIINFSSPYTFTGAGPIDIDVAPGWVLHLEGTGTAVFTLVSLNSNQPQSSNAPYALEINLSGGWTGTPYLRQRFDQNGILWANKYVACSVTAKFTGSPSSNTIIGDIYDSFGNKLQTILPAQVLNNTYNQYQDYGQVPPSANTNFPPAAWVEFRLLMPTNIDIFLTSFQLIASDAPTNFEYEQDTIERQVDHTFHYYQNSILRQQKDDILTGWDFGLNPWQFSNTAQTTITSNSYITDQTILIQQEFVNAATTLNVSAGRATFANNYGLTIQAVKATNQFAILQWIDPSTCRQNWGSAVSAMVKLTARKQGVGNLRMKAKLIYRNALPNTLTQTDPISAWAALGEPVKAAAYTFISPKNDPVYNITNGANTLLFEGFTLPASTNDAMTLGIMLYTLDPMVETGTPDNIIFNKVSLVQNDFAIESNQLSFDETLRRCQFYYCKSFPLNVPPVVGSAAGQFEFPQTVAALTPGVCGQIQFPVRMRQIPTGKVILYNPININNLIRNVVTGDCAASAAANIADNSFTPTYTSNAASTSGEGLIFQWSADARLGV